MKFTKGNNSDFFRGLKKEVQDYFDKTGQAKTANTAFWVKGILLVGVYIAAYAMIYVFQEKPMLALASGIIMGMSGVMIVFNIVHDASHSAVSKHKWVNKALCYLGDWVGINTYIWDLRHNVQHHTYTNVLGGDLNTHIVHHLFPRVCHCHYYALTSIIEAYCEKTGYLYKSESLKDAVLSHFRYLRNLADTEVYENMPVAEGKAA